MPSLRMSRKYAGSFAISRECAAKVCFLKENGIARVCEAHFCSIYILSHRPEAPQGSVSPVAVTGRPISWESTRPENFFSSVEIR